MRIRLALAALTIVLPFAGGRVPSAGLAADRTGPSSSLAVPAGFRIEVVADEVGPIRALAFAPDGRLFGARTSSGDVLALSASAPGGPLDRRGVFASDLDGPFGLAFDRSGSLYVAEHGRLVRFRGAAGAVRGGTPEPVAELVGGGGHTTRSVVVPPSGRLLVAAGSSCNVCVERDRRRAAVVEVDPATGASTLFAEGLRNTVGLAVHPATGELFGGDNGRDWLGDDLPAEEINIVRRGRHYGWPFCYGDRVPDRDASRDPAPAPPSPDFCASTEPPVVKIQAHSAPLGLAFYTGTAFPGAYRGDLFVTLHGSWNRSQPTGYKVVRVPMARDGTPKGTVEDFVTGWLSGERPWGRPIGIAVGPDGALYVSDDRGGRIYRVSYAKD